MCKRKRPDSTVGLSEDEKKLCAFIRSKKENGATVFELRTETTITTAAVGRAITALMKNNLIKEVPDMNNKCCKHYLGIEFEPSLGLTGGVWYKDGDLDIEKIDKVKETCVKVLLESQRRKSIMTFEILCNYFGKTATRLSKEETKEILKNLVLDNEIVEMKSTGLDEFSGLKVGEVCYKLTGKQAGNGDARGLAAVPCGVCPHIAICSPGGAISPTTCDYFLKWLDRDF